MKATTEMAPDTGATVTPGAETETQPQSKGTIMPILATTPDVDQASTVTVAELAATAAELGHSPADVLPDSWATQCEIDRTFEKPWISHAHEYVHGEYSIRLEHMIQTIDYEADATVSWSRSTADGLSQHEDFSVNISGIPALINVLQDARKVVTDGAGSPDVIEVPELDWEEYSATWLEAHPEVSAAIPQWGEEVEFVEIDDETGEAEFRITRKVGYVTMWASGERDKHGVVTVDAAPDLILPSAELDTTGHDDAINVALTIAVNMQTVISLLTTQSRPLRRAADVNERLMELDS